MKIKQFWYNVGHRPDGSRINIMYYIFFYYAAVAGIAFAFLPGVLGADRTVLFQQTIASHGTSHPTSWWGIALLFTVAINIVGIGIRNASTITTGAFMGVLCWLYALVTYIEAHFAYGVLAGSVPQLTFWIYYYLRVNKLSSGKIPAQIK